MVRRALILGAVLLGFLTAQKGQGGYLTAPYDSPLKRLFRSADFNDRTYNVLNDGRVATYFTNYGLVGYYNPSVEYPTNSGHAYAWQIGLMVGAMIDTSSDGVDNPVPLVSDSYEDYGEKNFNPLAGYTAGGLAPRVAVSNDPGTWPSTWPEGTQTGVSGWPGMAQFDYQPVASQEAYWVMRDYNQTPFDTRNALKPSVGALEVVCRGMESNTTMTSRYIFFLYDIINKSGQNIDNGRVGIMVDPDHPAHLSTDYADDSGEFFPSLNLAMSYDFDNHYDPWPGQDIAYMGMMFLKSPTDAAGDELGMTSWKAFPYSKMPKSGTIDGVFYPSRDAAQYAYMAPGVYSPSPQVNVDLCYVIASGNFTIAAGDTQRVAIALIMGDDREQLLKTAESALTIYRNDFRVPSSPDPPVVHTTVDSGTVTLYWDSEPSESSLDQLTGKADFEGYRIYRSTDFGTSWGIPTDNLEDYPLGYLPLADFNKLNTVNELGSIETGHTTIVSNATITALGIVPGTRNMVNSTYLINFTTDSTFQVLDARNGWLLELNQVNLSDGFCLVAGDSWDTTPVLIPVEGEGPITSAPFIPGSVIYVGGVFIQIENFGEDCSADPNNCVMAGDVFQVKTVVLDKGADTGLDHSWTDTDVLNGIEYWYAVTAYDRPDPSLDIPRNEVSPATSVNTAAGPHTVSAIPIGPVNNLIPGSLDVSGLIHSGGTGTGTVEIRILNPAELQAGTYTLGFTVPDNQAGRFSLVCGATDTILTNRTYPTLSGAARGVDFTPVTDGFRVVVVDDPLDTLGFFLTEGDSAHYDFSAIALDLPGSNANPVIQPRDIRVAFSEALSVTNYGPRPGQDTVSVHFSIWDVTRPEAPFRLHGMFKDLDPKDEWGPNDLIVVLDVPFDSTFPAGTFNGVKGNHAILSIDFGGTQEDSVSHADSTFAETHWAGDVWELKTSRPFKSDDVFTFTTVASSLSGTLDLSKIKVVPNPFIVSAPWDTRSGSHKIQFTHLPETCTITIYTIAGDRVRRLKHTEGSYEWWDLKSESDMDVAFGVFLYHVLATVDGREVETTGKIMVIR